MNLRTRLNYLIDWVIFLAIAFLFFSGVVLWGWLRPAGMSGPAGPGQVAASASAHPADPNAGPKASPKADIAPAAQNSPSAEPSVPKAAATDSAPKSRIFWGLIEANTFWGMTKNGGWKSLHCWIGIGLLLPFMILHLIMHFGWIVSVTRSICGGKKSKNVLAPVDSDGPNG